MDVSGHKERLGTWMIVLFVYVKMEEFCVKQRYVLLYSASNQYDTPENAVPYAQVKDTELTRCRTSLWYYPPLEMDDFFSTMSMQSFIHDHPTIISNDGVIFTKNFENIQEIGFPTTAIFCMLRCLIIQ